MRIPALRGGVELAAQLMARDAGKPFRGLRVCLDAANVALSRGTGIATYARGLAETLLAGGASAEFLVDRPLGADIAYVDVAAFDAQLEVQADAASAGIWRRRLRIAWSLAENGGGVRARRQSGGGAVLREQYADRLPAAAGIALAPGLETLSSVLFARTRRFIRVDMPQPPRIFHWTRPYPARMVGAVNLYTIHDLAPILLPDTTLDPKSLFIRLLTAIARSKDHVLTVSNSARREIIERLGVPEERISVLAPAVEADRTVAAENETTRRAFVESVFGLPWRSYFLFFGSIEPKKNISRLIEAFAGAAIGADLVIVSAQAWLSERDFHLIAPFADGTSGPLANRVRRIDYLPRRDLERLISGARAVIMTSRHEGFGLPIAEAALYGTPALVCNQGATAETAGDGGLKVDPLDVRAIRGGLERLAADDGLAEELGVRALRGIGRFSRASQTAALSEIYSRIGL